jgi:hypothetical protein
MVGLRLATLNLAILALLVGTCVSFNVARQISPVRVKPTIGVALSPLFGAKRPKIYCEALFMTEDPVEPEEIEAKDAEVISKKSEESGEEKRGVTKTVLLTVPLFCKFVIVLLIKLVTDLFVFPLLFLYRLAGLAKRRILRIFAGKGPKKDDAPNGSSH